MSPWESFLFKSQLFFMSENSVTKTSTFDQKNYKPHLK